MSDKVDRGPVTRFKYGSVVRRDTNELEVRGDLWTCDGKVVDPRQLFYEERRSADRVIDCRELIVAPGFVDLQINGVLIPIRAGDEALPSVCFNTSVILSW